MRNKGAPSSKPLRTGNPLLLLAAPSQEMQLQFSQVWWDSEFSALLMAEGEWGSNTQSWNISPPKLRSAVTEKKYSKLVEPSPFLINRCWILGQAPQLSAGSAVPPSAPVGVKLLLQFQSEAFRSQGLRGILPRVTKQS